MKFLVNFSKLFIGDMSIDLGSCYRSVAEHCLNRTNIGTVAKQVSGIRMPEGVGADFFANYASPNGMFFYNSLNTSWG